MCAMAVEMAPNHRHLQDQPNNSETCGNGIQDEGETCDDKNSSPEDGCDACQIQEGWECPTFGVRCDPICGDSMVKGFEKCDIVQTPEQIAQGVDTGCDQVTCEALNNWSCDEVSNTCTQRCGRVEFWLADSCDDFNKVSGDGCSSSCLVEEGWNCIKGHCTPICGDNLI